jgi:SNF2 family DNA or RNA helicase
MKTQPMKHQVEGLDRLSKHPYYLLACEQGTGKTWMFMADAEARFLAGQIDGVLVIAPNGVHTNWTRREIPTHMSVPLMACAYTAAPTKRLLKQIEKLFAPQDPDERTLRVLAISIDSINTNSGYQMAERFLNAMRCILILDESSRIKNMESKRTGRCLRLAELARVRRCGSGTPITNSPTNAFAQFEFLRTGLLGTRSYRSFAAEYTQMMPPNSRLVLDVVARRDPNAVRMYRQAIKDGDDVTAANLLRRIARFAPQIPAVDDFGMPRYRNLEKLNKLMEPHMYRVTKAECLDLPEKIYQTHFFELTARQRAIYDFVNEHMRYEHDDGRIDIFNALTKMTKLQQITSGFMINADGEPQYVEELATPRITALIGLIEDIEGKFIVWARYKEEIRSITAALAAAGIEYVEYHGDIRKADREEAVDSLQVGTARAFVGNGQSGGIGLTLTKAETVIYYSNDFNLETRLQSEDRAHRIGTVKNVNYIDLAAVDTIDERIARALQIKEEVASIVLGDRI